MWNKYQFCEKEQYNYVHVDSTTNSVYLLLPLVGGDEIGTDNTCQAVNEMIRFLGLSDSHQDKGHSALDILNRLKLDLNADIKYCKKHADYAEYKELFEQKQSRLEQVEQYIVTLTALQGEATLRDTLQDSIPYYPKAIHEVFKNRNNAFTVLLSPRVVDSFTRQPAHLFTLKRTSYGNGVVNDCGEIFREAFKDMKDKPVADMTAKGQIIAMVESRFGKTKVDVDDSFINQVRDFIREKIELGNPELKGVLDLNKSIYPGNPVVNRYALVELLDIIPDSDTPTNIALAIMSAAVQEVFWSSLGTTDDLVSPFYQYYLKPDHLSMMTQFFLAHANIHANANGLSDVDFGAVLDSKPHLSREITQRVLTALEIGISIEEVLIDWINQHRSDFSLRKLFSEEGAAKVQRRFKEQYHTIEGLAEKDEFMILLSDIPGDCINHMSKISLNFAAFINKGYPMLGSELYTKLGTDFLDLMVNNLGQGRARLPEKTKVNKPFNLKVDGDLKEFASPDVPKKDPQHDALKNSRYLENEPELALPYAKEHLADNSINSAQSFKMKMDGLTKRGHQNEAHPDLAKYFLNVAALINYIKNDLPEQYKAHQETITTLLDSSIALPESMSTTDETDEVHLMLIKHCMESLMDDEIIATEAAGLLDRILLFVNNVLSFLARRKLSFFQDSQDKVSFEHAKDVCGDFLTTRMDTLSVR